MEENMTQEHDLSEAEEPVTEEENGEALTSASNRAAFAQADAFNKKIAEQKKSKKKERRGLTLSALKGITIVLMILTGMSTALFAPFLNGLLEGVEESEAIQEIMSGYMTEFTTYYVLVFLSSAFLPLICYLMVDGFIRSQRPYRNLVEVAVTAVISEVPYDLAVNKTWSDLSSQNLFFGLFLGLAVLNLLRLLEKKFAESKAVLYILEVLVVLAGMFLSMMGLSLYGAYPVLIMAVMYLFRDKKLWGAALGCFAFSAQTYFFSMLALVPIALYNGKKGKNMGYVIYIVYPVSLLALWGIGKAVGM